MVIFLTDKGRSETLLVIGPFRASHPRRSDDGFADPEAAMVTLSQRPKTESANTVLKSLLEASTALVGGCTQGEVFQKILEGIQQLGFRRVRLYLISDDGVKLKGVAQIGTGESFVGVEWDVAADEHMQILLREPWPHVFRTAPERSDRKSVV